jgi:predicted N-acetyltransferase YhbS
VHLTIRRRSAEDEAAILALVRSAFNSDDHDAQEEVDLVISTWGLGASLEDLDLVAVSDGVTVGHVLGAVGHLGDHTVVAVAPLCVIPARQGQGIGTALMEELLTSAERQGWPMVVLLGAPDYYTRFGFEPSGPLGIVYPPVGPNDPHFQVRRLGTFDSSLRGTFSYCWERPPI